MCGGRLERCEGKGWKVREGTQSEQIFLCESAICERRRKHFGRTNVIFEFGLSFHKYYFYDGELKAGNAKMYSGDTSERYPSTSHPQMAIFCIKKKKKGLD